MDRFEQIISLRRQLRDIKFNEEKTNPIAKEPIDLAAYPWDQCVADQIDRYGDKDTAEKICGAIKAMYASKEEMGIVKEGFPIPSPESGEDEQKYISRCISKIIDEYGQEQASAICYSKWREK